MAGDRKFSAIASAGAIAGTDTALGVQSGTTDVQYTIANLATYYSAHIGAGVAATMAIGGATIGSNALAVTGTSLLGNIVGANAPGTNTAATGITVTNALSSGSATNPDLIFQTGVKTGSGTTQGTATTALTIKGETQQIVGVEKTFGTPAFTSSADLTSGMTPRSNEVAFFVGGTRQGYFNTTTLTLVANAVLQGSLTVPGVTTAAFSSSGTFTSGAAASVGTLTNAPSAGNPTSWIKIVDNGVTRYIPAW